MKLYTRDGKMVETRACPPPMSHGRVGRYDGRSWDGWTFSIDDQPHECYVDTTWGRCWYFLHLGRCYRVRLCGPGGIHPDYDLALFTKPPSQGEGG